MSLQIFRRRGRPLGPWLADLREFAGVLLAFVALSAAGALIAYFGAHR